ncbi:MAG TPA: hypothetical protein VGK17_11560 [Propionicimonas sp.]|jgi:hypothetical protein
MNRVSQTVPGGVVISCPTRVTPSAASYRSADQLWFAVVAITFVRRERHADAA